MELVSQSETDSYELELSGLSPADLKALKARYESDDDPDGAVSSTVSAVDLSDKSPMRAAMMRAALDKLAREAKKKAQRIEAARKFRLDVYAGKADPPFPRHNARYWATPERLLRLGHDGRAPRRGHTVTDFTRWVHSLYAGSSGTPAAMREGKFIERSIAKLTQPLSHRDWELVYCDPLIEGRKPDAKPIPALSLHGAPTWGAPDLVFRHRPTGELVIVERKASDKQIPVDGWPDLRAQLWCYAQIDDPAWREAPAIRMVGEVWARRADGKVYLRQSEGGLMRWAKGDAEFEEQNGALFALYKERMEA